MVRGLAGDNPLGALLAPNNAATRRLGRSLSNRSCECVSMSGTRN